MELSLLLMKKILSMAIMVAVGYFAAKKKWLKESDTQALSVLCLYVVCPCMFISALRMEFSVDKLKGLLLCTLAAIAVHIIFITVTWLISRTGRIDKAQQDSVVYANCGNLILPIISSILGPDATFYACAFIMVQTVFIWTHGMYTLGGRSMVDIKKIITNPNILAIAAGLILYFTQLSLPSPINDAVDSLGAMIGPLGMLIAGVIMANVDLTKVFTNAYAYVICFLRLILYPLILVLVLKVSQLTVIIPGSTQLFMVTFLGAIGPTASTVTQMAKINNCDYQGASVTNVMSIILCIITMPLMIFVYQWALY